MVLKQMFVSALSLHVELEMLSTSLSKPDLQSL